MRWVNTTVSFTPCSRSKPAEGAARCVARWLGLVVLAVLLGGAARPAAAQGPLAEVTQLRLERNGDGIYLNAAVQFELPTLVAEVLDKGIAVYFV
ncbi:MAG: DUF4390 domain-containing protein, partial [Comamonadaceae bacterium]